MRKDVCGFTRFHLSRLLGKLKKLYLTDREAPRFLSGYTGSAACAEHIPIEKAYTYNTSDGKSALEDGLHQINYLGQSQASHRHSPLLAHFEIRIEQGPRKGNAQQIINKVISTQGIRWHSIVVKRERHMPA